MDRHQEILDLRYKLRNKYNNNLKKAELYEKIVGYGAIAIGFTSMAITALSHKGFESFSLLDHLSYEGGSALIFLGLNRTIDPSKRSRDAMRGLQVLDNLESLSQ